MTNHDLSQAVDQLENELHQSNDAASANPEAMQQFKTSAENLRHSAAALEQAGGAQTQSLIQTIANDTNAVLGAISMLPLPGPGNAIVRLVQVLLPTVFGAAGLFWPGAEATASQPQPNAAQQQQQQQPQDQQQPAREPQSGPQST